MIDSMIPWRSIQRCSDNCRMIQWFSDRIHNHSTTLRLIPQSITASCSAFELIRSGSLAEQVILGNCGRGDAMDGHSFVDNMLREGACKFWLSQFNCDAFGKGKNSVGMALIWLDFSWFLTFSSLFLGFYFKSTIKGQLWGKERDVVKFKVSGELRVYSGFLIQLWLSRVYWQKYIYYSPSAPG